MRNVFFLCLIVLVFQSCLQYKMYISPNDINSQYDVEGVYSNVMVIDTLKNRGQRIDGVFYFWWEVDSLKHKAYRTETLWRLIDRREIKEDSIRVKVEIVNPKSLKFSFLRNDEIIGTKLLKGKFKKDKCFYTRRVFYIVPLFPIIWWYESSQKRIYRIDDELIIEAACDGAGGFLIFMEGSGDNGIWRFKRLNDLKK